MLAKLLLFSIPQPPSLEERIMYLVAVEVFILGPNQDVTEFGAVESFFNLGDNTFIVLLFLHDISETDQNKIRSLPGPRRASSLSR